MLDVKVVVMKVTPMERTKEKAVTIDPTKHCRVCTRVYGKASEHDASMLHSSTVIYTTEAELAA